MASRPVRASWTSRSDRPEAQCTAYYHADDVAFTHVRSRLCRLVERHRFDDGAYTVERDQRRYRFSSTLADTSRTITTRCTRRTGVRDRSPRHYAPMTTGTGLAWPRLAHPNLKRAAESALAATYTLPDVGYGRPCRTISAVASPVFRHVFVGAGVTCVLTAIVLITNASTRAPTNDAASNGKAPGRCRSTCTRRRR